MASSLNKITLIGNIGRDPEVRLTNDGTKIATFSVATSETWKDKLTGERKESTEWHNVVVFNPRLAEIVENYYRKGHRVYVEGQLRSRKYTDDQGIERKIWDVSISRYKGESMLIERKDGLATPSGEPGYRPVDQNTNTSSHVKQDASPYGASSFSNQQQNAVDQDDDIPF